MNAADFHRFSALGVFMSPASSHDTSRTDLLDMSSYCQRSRDFPPFYILSTPAIRKLLIFNPIYATSKLQMNY